MRSKIFAELVEKIIVFKDKTVTLVLKIDKDLNSYFDKKSIDLSNFTLILPPKSLKFEESKRKIKISPNEENSGRDSIETSNNHRMYRLKIGLLGRSRTRNLLVRSQTLYPVELLGVK